MKIQPNDPAMPAITETLTTGIATIPIQSDGLSIRAELAARAMQGLLSNHAMIDTTAFEWIAKQAVGYADALIKELNKD